MPGFVSYCKQVRSMRFESEMAEKQNTNIRSVADEPGNMRTIRRADVTLIHDSLIPCFLLMMSCMKGVGGKSS